MSRLNARLCPPQKEPLKPFVFESRDHGGSVTCNATGYKMPNGQASAARGLLRVG
jgi:hypothetical protein